MCKLHCFFNRIYADLAFVTAFAFKFNAAFNFSVDGVIFTHAYVVAGIEAGTGSGYRADAR